MREDFFPWTAFSGIVLYSNLAGSISITNTYEHHKKLIQGWDTVKLEDYLKVSLKLRKALCCWPLRV